MKKIYSHSLLLIILLVPSIFLCQNNPTKEYSKDFLIQQAKEIMLNAGNCTLISLDSNGIPRARIMDPFSPDEDLSVWFGTNSKSRKVNQIKNDPRVSLYYFDTKSTDYVLIHGNAKIVDDQNEKDIRWKENWKDFYPDRSKSYSLIKVSPIWMEVLSTSRRIFGDSISWKPPSVILDLRE